MHLAAAYLGKICTMTCRSIKKIPSTVTEETLQAQHTSWCVYIYMCTYLHRYISIYMCLIGNRQLISFYGFTIVYRFTIVRFTFFIIRGGLRCHFAFLRNDQHKNIWKGWSINGTFPHIRIYTYILYIYEIYINYIYILYICIVYTVYK